MPDRTISPLSKTVVTSEYALYNQSNHPYQCPIVYTFNSNSNYSNYSGSQVEKMESELARIESNNTNFGYGLGRILGQWIGTIPVDTLPEVTINRDQNNQEYSELKNENFHNMSYWSAFKFYLSHFVKISSKYIGVYDYFANDHSKPPNKMDNNVIKFTAAHDFNRALEASRTINSYIDYKIDEKGYILHQEFMSKPEDICSRLQLNYPDIKFDAIIFHGHGSYRGIKLKMNNGEAVRLLSENIEYDLHCLPNHLKPNAKIILRSCSTGSINTLPLNPVPLKRNVDINFALSLYRFLSKSHPDIEIAAPACTSFLAIENIDPLIFTAYGRKSSRKSNVFYNCGVNYNKNSVYYIDEGNKLLDNQPSGTDVSDKVLTLWYNQFDKNRRLLKKALNYSPQEEQKDIRFGWFYKNIASY